LSIVDFPVSRRESRMNALQTGDPLEQFGEQRRCGAPDCRALLSRYNPASTCSLHRGWIPGPTPRRKR